MNGRTMQAHGLNSSINLNVTFKLDNEAYRKAWKCRMCRLGNVWVLWFVPYIITRSRQIGEMSYAPTQGGKQSSVFFFFVSYYTNERRQNPNPDSAAILHDTRAMLYTLCRKRKTTKSLFSFLLFLGTSSVMPSITEIGTLSRYCWKSGTYLCITVPVMKYSIIY